MLKSGLYFLDFKKEAQTSDEIHCKNSMRVSCEVSLCMWLQQKKKQKGVLSSKSTNLFQV